MLGVPVSARARVPCPDGPGGGTNGPGAADTVRDVARDPEPWRTDTPGPFVTIRTGGPLDGTVTITAVENGHGRNRVAASWRQHGEEVSQSLEAATYRIARSIAHAAARQLSIGNDPHLARG